MKIQAVTSGAEVEVSRPAASARKSDAASSPAQATGPEGVVVPSNPNVVVPVQSVEKSKEMERLAEEVQRHFRGDPSKLDISLDKDLKMIVTKVLNADSGEVIRQYPPESVIEVIKYLRAQRGMIVNQKG
jgi:flagellar protein FlaG